VRRDFKALSEGGRYTEAVAPAGSILVGVLVILITGIVGLAVSGRRRAKAAVREADARADGRLAEAAQRLSEHERRLEELAQERKGTETRLREQLMRFALLDRITRAIGERQDTESIFQTVAATLEAEMPVDLACICAYDAVTRELIVTSAGPRSAATAAPLRHGTRILMEASELAGYLRGQLIHEPDVSSVQAALPARVRAANLLSMVAAPLQLESGAHAPGARALFGLLVVARARAGGFTSSDCEFLRQLSEHVALAAHQAQLLGALQLAYDDLRRTQQSVMQQERLRALGEMASGAAHNINNAISPVMLYTESLLETEPALSPRAREYLETIRRSIADVALTVARMREFHRPRETQQSLAPVSLNEVAREAADLTKVRWSDIPQQRGFVVRMRMELEDDLPKVLAVASEVREAAINLIFNAVEAMPSGGTLTLRTRHSLGTEGSDGDESPSIALEVVDSGVGMDEDTRRRCVEPFFTTKGERGSGLGLATVYGVVEHVGARIDIESAPGLGTTVRLAFPVPVMVDRTMTLEPVARPTQLRILIVDDDPTLIKSLRDALESDGHSVATAGGGREGIEMFRAALDGQQPFAVVVTDLGMPYVDGRQVAAAVKEASGSTRVVMLTGWGQRLANRGEVPAHVDRLLSKPPRLRDLREALS
jgi:signal transduction histidine kinase